MSEVTALDIVKSAAAGKGSKVEGGVESLLMAKVSDALAVKRTDIARHYMDEPSEDDAEEFADHSEDDTD
jgi:hypothetical protein